MSHVQRSLLEIKKRLLFPEEARRWATFGWNTKHRSSLAGHVSSHASPASDWLLCCGPSPNGHMSSHAGTTSEKCDAVDKSCLRGTSARLEGVNGISAPVAQALNTGHWE